MKKLYLALSLLFTSSHLFARRSIITLKRNSATGQVEGYQKSRDGKHRWEIVQEESDNESYAAFKLRCDKLFLVSQEYLCALRAGEKMKFEVSTPMPPRKSKQYRKALRNYARREVIRYNEKKQLFN